MGCPILLGYAEKAAKVSKEWSSAMAYGEYPPDLTREALEATALFKAGLERRAKAALRQLVLEVLKQALVRSKMRDESVWLADVPADLEYKATQAVLQKIKDRAIAWKVHNDLLIEGRAVGEFDMVFVDRVWGVASIADDLIHDMAQESYTTAGAALASAMAITANDTAEWLKVFAMLKETN
jgi:hypothetical protein